MPGFFDKYQGADPSTRVEAALIAAEEVSLGDAII